MATEIERKFLLKSEAWRYDAKASKIRQAVLAHEPQCIVRIRVRDDRAYVTIKGPRLGISRAEFEYEVPLQEGEALLAMAPHPVVEKTRYLVPFAGFVWEIDEFHGRNQGLIVAEIELPAEDTPFEIPHWLGEEVSQEERYSNSELAHQPYDTW